VDDDRPGATALAELLWQSGYTVRVAHTGVDALVVARTMPAGVILLDLALPDVDGFEVARRVAADPLTSSHRIVGITGWANMRLAAEEQGICPLLRKPLTTADLLDALSSKSP
jgi:two-component system CheB/CheR fusion protein